MNVPEYARATETAVRTFDKRIAEAREELDGELERCRRQFLEEQPVAAEIEYVPKRP